LAVTNINSTASGEGDKLYGYGGHNAEQDDHHYQLYQGESALPSHQKFPR
jgi:hypothetical protein